MAIARKEGKKETKEEESITTGKPRLWRLPFFQIDSLVTPMECQMKDQGRKLTHCKIEEWPTDPMN